MGWMNKLAVLALLAACGDNAVPEAPDAGVDAPPPWAEAVPSSVPQLISLGGVVLDHPKVQPIFFASDPLQAQVEQFLTELGASDYWKQTTEEYGVGALTVLPSIVTTDAPPATDDALPGWIDQHVPTPDAQTIYTLFLGDGVVLHGQDGDSCEAYGAFHDESPNHVVYALMPRCEPSTDFDHAQNKLDELTISASHEIIEAATDPYVETTPAYGDVDADHAIWSIVPGAETGDFCEYLDSAYIRGVGDFMVQRTWSNAAARAGHDPCLPAPATPYIAAAPMFTESVPFDGYTGRVQTKAMELPVNMSKTIDIDLFSDQPTDAYQIDIEDGAAMYGDPAELAFTWDTQSGKNGDTLHLTIQRLRAAGYGAPGSIFLLSTKTASGTVSQWWGYVAN
jgi:hypothetical protein